MISVVIPLYNKEKYIEETLKNVLNQTYSHFEIIVVNDGSTDNGAKIVENFQDHRVRLINKQNGGVSSARNLGIQEAHYHYIAFLDADDAWLPNHLEEIHQLIENYGGQADVFVTNFARKYPDGRLVSNRTASELPEGLIQNYFKIVAKKALIHTSCVCVSKSALVDVEGFNERFSNGEDIDLWIRLARKYKIVYSPSVTEEYLMEAANNSSNIKDFKKVAANYIDFSKCIDIYDFKFNLERFVKVKISKFLK